MAQAGIIGFVGLVAPHVLRRLLGEDYRLLLPASALGGGALLALADLLARTLARPAELPVGVVTTLLGGPFFLYLMWRRRGRLEARGLHGPFALEGVDLLLSPGEWLALLGPTARGRPPSSG